MFSEVGIRPWELDKLTVEQFNEAIAIFDDQLKKQKELENK